MKRIAGVHAAVAVCVVAATVSAVPVAAAEPGGADELVVSLTGSDVGAKVQVLVWPNSTELEKLPAGVSVPLRSVPVRKNGTGAFVADLSGLPATYLEAGKVNFELRTMGKKALMWSGVDDRTATGLARALTVDTTAGRVLQGGAGPAAAVSLASDGTATATADPTTRMTSMRMAAQAQLSEGIITPQACGVTTTNTYQYNLREIFASAFAWSGATITADFDTGSSHTLGIKVGSGQSGTASIATSAGSTETGIVDKYLTNRVNYRKYINNCTGEYWRPASFYAILPPSDFVSASHVNYSNCTKYYTTSSPWKQGVKNITYSSGVTFGSVNLSAQSGWTSATKMKFVITATSAICGSTASGWASSPISASRKW